MQSTSSLGYVQKESNLPPHDDEFVFQLLTGREKDFVYLLVHACGQFSDPFLEASELLLTFEGRLCG